MNDDLRDTDNDYKKQFAFFLGFKDTTELVDNYENMFNQLSNEIPLVNKSLNRMKELLKSYFNIIENGLKENVNYDEEFEPQERRDFKEH